MSWPINATKVFPLQLKIAGNTTSCCNIHELEADILPLGAISVTVSIPLMEMHRLSPDSSAGREIKVVKLSLSHILLLIWLNKQYLTPKPWRSCVTCHLKINKTNGDKPPDVKIKSSDAEQRARVCGRSDLLLLRLFDICQDPVKLLWKLSFSFFFLPFCGCVFSNRCRDSCITY